MQCANEGKDQLRLHRAKLAGPQQLADRTTRPIVGQRRTPRRRLRDGFLGWRWRFSTSSSSSSHCVDKQQRWPTWPNSIGPRDDNDEAQAKPQAAILARSLACPSSNGLPRLATPRAPRDDDK
jgi:hypothetical protein